MKLIPAVQQDGASILINLEQIQLVVFRKDPGDEKLMIHFSGRDRPDVTLRSQEAIRVWTQLLSNTQT
jgi:hypothetical protein